MTTRVAGELSLEEVRAPVPRAPGGPPAPDRIEVTQPYIPAIREQQPQFAKRPPLQGPGSGPPAPLSTTSEIAAPDVSVPMGSAAAPTAPTEVVTAPRKPDGTPSPARGPAAPRAKPAGSPPKRRSLARRVVRGIVGPDLLRKDPVNKRK